MTSTRLPGKVLMEVMGRPLLSYQIERLRFSKRINEIIIATTTNKEDDPVAELAYKEGLKVFRGSEDDVLDRYYQAAKEYRAKHIMRLTADCPLIDPVICDLVIDEYLKSGANYVHTGPSFAEGVDSEIFSFKSLEEAWKKARLRSEREHCTLFFHNHPEKFKKITMCNDTDDSKYRITVDRPEDFLVVKAVFEGLYNTTNRYFGTGDIKRFLDSHPSIFQLNSSVVRNEGLIESLKEDRKVV
jgi:spore coat polysaccharide biosynthesis protein SpsF